MEDHNWGVTKRPAGQAKFLLSAYQIFREEVQFSLQFGCSLSVSALAIAYLNNIEYTIFLCQNTSPCTSQVHIRVLPKRPANRTSELKNTNSQGRCGLDPKLPGMTLGVCAAVWRETVGEVPVSVSV
jgi:hypothetical protein